ncbi:MAG TPA: YicC/YloC family endoribonuclease [Patescibacteria group bacterium]|jgi:uncharacterized protein (TIGR00255 family)|nr:YicC/YloC family endoribonuclease [Patescibacteria group bacterium]
MKDPALHEPIWRCHGAAVPRRYPPETEADQVIKSMTGFGRGEASAGPFRAAVEVRSVNHRFADLKIKLPTELAGLDQLLHQRIQGRVSRGRLDVNVSVSRGADEAPGMEINRPVVSSYVKAAESLKQEFGLAGEVTIQSILGLPDVLKSRISPGAASREEQEAVLAAFDAAMAAHDAMRLAEGKILARDMAGRIEVIRKLQERIAERAPNMLPLYVKRLKQRLGELDGAGAGGNRRIEIDDSRLAQEVALVADRSDITEELVRLAGYLEQLADLLGQASEPIGKKLDFIMQEMNREANTINSKAIDLSICQDAIDVKAEVEKIREQVQNIE